MGDNGRRRRSSKKGGSVKEIGKDAHQIHFEVVKSEMENVDADRRKVQSDSYMSNMGLDNVFNLQDGGSSNPSSINESNPLSKGNNQNQPKKKKKKKKKYSALI
eukprot:Selendium_serpulae@DN329_c0_g1_i3.p1